MVHTHTVVAQSHKLDPTFHITAVATGVTWRVGVAIGHETSVAIGNCTKIVICFYKGQKMNN